MINKEEGKRSFNCSNQHHGLQVSLLLVMETTDCLSIRRPRIPPAAGFFRAGTRRFRGERDGGERKGLEDLTGWSLRSG